MSKANRSTTTRRAFVKGGVLATSVLFPAAAVALPATPPGAPQPSATGRALLAALHERQRIWQAASDDHGSDLSKPPYAEPLDTANDRIAELCEAITSKPITSLSDVVDYALAASDDCHVLTDGEVSTHGDADNLRDFTVATLAFAGISIHSYMDTTD